MSVDPSAEKIGRRPADADLLRAAAEIVAESGLAGLTLRPLARRLDISVTVLSNHFGARSDILGSIIQAARAEDARILEPWRRRFSALAPLSAHAASDLADALFDELATRHRDISLLFVELVQAGSWDAGLRADFTPWFDDRVAFWGHVGACAGLPAALIATGYLTGYGLDELAYSIALKDLPAYRLLRRLCLRRLFTGFFDRDGVLGDLALFAMLFEDLDYPADVLRIVHGGSFPADWRADVARACAGLITTQGAGAVTHRAVAAAANVRPTTLSYRFPTQESLLAAGLEYMISVLLRTVEQGRIQIPDAYYDEQNRPRDLDVGRATFAIAIAASRMTQLIPCVADMRRRRGINLFRILQPSLAGFGLDRVSAQVLSIGFIGMRNAIWPFVGETPGVEPALAAIVDWTRSRTESKG